MPDKKLNDDWNQENMTDKRRPIKPMKIEQQLTRPRGDRFCHNAWSALTATFMKTGSPVSCVREPNSMTKVPTPAVHVTVVSPDGMPLMRFTVPYGIPVDVLNAATVQHQHMYTGGLATDRGR